MCTTNIYSYSYPDGHKEKVEQPNLCSNSRHGRPCSNNVLFRHPNQTVQYTADPTKVTVSQQLPPTPTYTPRSATPNYRSGDDSSDHSHRGSSGSRSRRASGLYINGQKVLDIEGRRSSRDPSRRERIVLVDNPPTPRTPPQTFTGPHTAPPSPNQNYTTPYIVDAQPQHRMERPVFVDERNKRVHIEVLDPNSRSHHKRHSSTSSHESRHSSRHSRSSDDDEERRRRRRHREERAREEQEIREQRMRARIAKANAEISNRAPVPVVHRSSTFTRPVVEVVDHDAAQLTEALRRMEIDQVRRAAEKAQRQEDEAQKQRLMERMMPKRRSTVGPGSRRHRVMYDDGLYRWE